MPTMTYSLSSFTKTNTNLTAGTTFTAYASGSPVSNASITSGSLYLSSLQTYTSVGYLDFSLGGGSGSTNTFSSNSSSHSETVSLSGYSNALLTAGSGTITFTVRRTSTGSGNVMNVRDGLSGTLTLNYNLNYSACGAPTAVSVSANNVAPGASVTLSWSGASAGTGNAITGYQIYRATAAAGTYSLLTSVSTSASSGSTAVTAQTASGSSYYYKVLTVGTVSGYNSGQSSAYATLTCSFSATTAPSAVTLNSAAEIYALAGASITLAWSGAAAGTNNPISGYAIYRSGASWQTVSTSATSGSYTVQAHATPGSSYYFQVMTQGPYANSALSISRYLYTYSHPEAPTSMSLSNANPEAGASVTLSWSSAAAGSFNAITGYEVHRSTAAAGPYSLLTTVSTSATSSSCSVTAHATMGGAYYYKIVTVGARSSSAISASYVTLTSKANTAPNPPVIQAPLANATTYNPNPRVLVTLAMDAEGHLQVLNASGFTASSTGNLSAGKKILLQRTAALTSATSLSASLSAADTHGATSTTASRSFNYAEASYTDTMLTAGVTAIKAAHVNELRTQVGNVRAYYGLAAAAWAEGVASGVTKLANWKAHILELRIAMDEIVAYVNGWDTASAVNRITPPVWIDISVNKPTVAVMNQLRQVIRTL